MNLTLKRKLPSVLRNRPVYPSLLKAIQFNGDLEFPLIGATVPSVNVSETPAEFVLELAAPGLTRKDFNIEINNHVLCISSEKKEEKKDTGRNYKRREYSFTGFSRSFELPKNVAEDTLDATYENGILKVTVPKRKESIRPARKIFVS